MPLEDEIGGRSLYISNKFTNKKVPVYIEGLVEIAKDLERPRHVWYLQRLETILIYSSSLYP